METGYLVETQENSFSILPILISIFTVGMIVTLLMSLFSLFSLFRIVRKSEKYDIGGEEILVYSGKLFSPFSIGNHIIISKEDLNSDLSMIISHESAHIQRNHWIDLILARCVIILQWYNPLAWLLLRDLKDAHEYQADNDTIHEGYSPKEYQLMLIGLTASRLYPGYSNQLNNNNLKKRIIMMKTKTSGVSTRLRALLLLPLMAAAISAAALPSVREMIATISSSEMNLEIGNSHDSQATYNQMTDTNSPSDQSKTSTAPQKIAEYPGGMGAMMKALADVMKYPETAVKDSIQGRVVVNFIVTKTGEVTKPKIVKSIREDLDKEAIRALLSIGKFIPAQNDGKPVDSEYTLPVNFRLK